MIKLGTDDLPKEDPKIYINHVINSVNSADIIIFSPEINVISRNTDIVSF